MAQEQRPSRLPTTTHARINSGKKMKVPLKGPRAALKSRAPSANAVRLAQSGQRFRLRPTDARPGAIAWLPWAGVIKITHKDFHRGSGDGVEVVFDGSDSGNGGNGGKAGAKAIGKMKDAKGKTDGKGTLKADSDRPRRRSWNHPCVILRRDGHSVWIMGITSFHGRTLSEKLAKYPSETRKKIAAKYVPIRSGGIGDGGRKGVGEEMYKPLRTEENGNGGKKTAGRSAIEGYVRLETMYKIDSRDLQRWGGASNAAVKEGKDAQVVMLDEDSTGRLLALVTKVCGVCWQDAKRAKVPEKVP